MANNVATPANCPYCHQDLPSEYTYNPKTSLQPGTRQYSEQNEPGPSRHDRAAYQYYQKAIPATKRRDESGP